LLAISPFQSVSICFRNLDVPVFGAPKFTIIIFA
jgi:hypothetical protein